MATKSGSAIRQRNGTTETIRRAFDEFLAFPTIVIVAFVLLAVGLNMIDDGHAAWLEPARTMLQQRFFADAAATSGLLAVIAGGIITVTSITISLLLLALQQVAGSLTAEVYDQFLRRRHNQGYFGFFVGLALYTLLTLATVNDGFNPVFGAAAAVVLAGVAMYLLIVLLYTTINQMRPEEVIHEIQRLTLASREGQLLFLARTRRAPTLSDKTRTPVEADNSGYVARIDLNLLDKALHDSAERVEVVLRVSMGSYVAFRDVIAEVVTETPAASRSLLESVRHAVHLERQRNLPTDPGNGIGQLEMIAWTSISTAKSDPGPGILAIHGLRDILARCLDESMDSTTQRIVPVVYEDKYYKLLMNAFESLAVVSTESMQHQAFAEILKTFSVLFHRLPPDQQARTEDIILRILSGMGDHVLTARLDEELSALADALTGSERAGTAAAVVEARDILARSVGTLNSRGTRVSSNR